MTLQGEEVVQVIGGEQQVMEEPVEGQVEVLGPDGRVVEGSVVSGDVE